MNEAAVLLDRLKTIRPEIDVDDMAQALHDITAPVLLAEPLALTEGMSIGAWLEAGRARFAAHRAAMELPARSMLARIDVAVRKDTARLGKLLELLVYAEAALASRLERVSDERELWQDTVESDPDCADIVDHLQGEEGRLRLMLGGMH
jgi:hypothetical protein